MNLQTPNHKGTISLVQQRLATLNQEGKSGVKRKTPSYKIEPCFKTKYIKCDAEVSSKVKTLTEVTPPMRLGLRIRVFNCTTNIIPETVEYHPKMYNDAKGQVQRLAT